MDLICGSGLREKILVDLHRHFKHRLENDRLYWCMAYDFLFVQLALTMAFVVTWRGTWENADTLFDEILFGGDVKASAATALLVGILGSVPILIWQKAVDNFAKKTGNLFRFLLVSRLFTVARFYFDVLVWKGVWGFYDHILGASWQLSAAALTMAGLVLLMLQCLRATLGTPIGMRFDRPEVHVSIPTAFCSENSDPFTHRIIDAAVTILINMIAVSVFYGTWTSEDFYFDDLDQAAYVQNLNAGKGLILGYSCVVSVFFLQFFMLDLHSLDRTVPRLTCTEYAVTSLYQVTLIIALCGNVTVFRCLWILLANTFLTSNVTLSRLLCQFGGILIMFMMYCGSSLHGGVVRESHRQRDGILISNFFITYFLSTKPEELPEEGEEEAELLLPPSPDPL